MPDTKVSEYPAFYMEKLKGKVILDTRKICDLDGVYRL